MTVAQTHWPPSLERVLDRRGIGVGSGRAEFFAPSLEGLSSPFGYPGMTAAVGRLRRAMDGGEPVALFADRDMDGFAGLTVLARSIRTLGGLIHWGMPRQGRGLDRAELDRLLGLGARVLILVDCGSGDAAELERLASLGIEVIVCDHHRLGGTRPPALAWIHPEHSRDEAKPAGCVMAFKLAHALWLSFIGEDDPERLDYFLFSHLDVLALGILADRVPLQGENRTLAWHGLRRLPQTRKTGLAALLRLLKLTPRNGPISTREASWRLIPLLNAAGRMGEPEQAAQLLMTEDAWAARQCIDRLLTLTQERRIEQDRSLAVFDEQVRAQCRLEDDPVLIALAKDLEPTMTGLAAQAIARQYGRPAALFVEQEEEAVGSVRGLDDQDLFTWIEEHRDLLVKFGGHEGAVGLTVRRDRYAELRQRLLASAASWDRGRGLPADDPEAGLSLDEADRDWWEAYRTLEPFGAGFPEPVFELPSIDRLEALNRRQVRGFLLHEGPVSWIAEWDGGVIPEGEGPWRVVATARETSKGDFPFTWIIREVTAARPSSLPVVRAGFPTGRVPS